MMRFASCFFVILLAFRGAPAADFEYFRSTSGVEGDDHRLPDDFQSDAREVWECELPPGISTPCVHGDAVYVTAFDEVSQQLSTIAIDRKSGKVRWKQTCPASQIEPFHRVGSPASSSPACNGELVYVFFGSYGLLCYDLKGNLVWQRKLGPFQDEFGASSSPVLAEGKVILSEDHDTDNYLIALDQKTGETIWKTPRNEFTRSYSTPVIWNHAEGQQVIVAGSLQLAGYSLESGKKLWWVNSLSRIVDSTPSVADELIYVATWTPGGDLTERISMEPFAGALSSLDKNKDSLIGKEELPDDSPIVPRFFRMDTDQDGRLNQAEWDRHASVFARAQNVAIAVRPDGSGDITEKAINWVHRRGLPTVPSSVVYRGVMYMVKDSGIITSLDAASGQQLKQGRAKGRGNYYASLVAGDGKVYLCSERGVVTVLSAGRSWEILSSHDFGARILATPVCDRGQMFIRTDKALHCLVKASR